MSPINAEAIFPGRTVPAEANYVPAAQLDAFLRQSRSAVLAEIHYGEAPGDRAETLHPRVAVGMRQLADPLVEVWTSALPVEYRRAGEVRFACNREILFGCLSFAQPGSGRFETTIRERYSEILDLLKAEGYPHLLRMWNYFPGIHVALGALDRYQCFCRGRYEALERFYNSFGGGFEQVLPSASAVGGQTGDFVLYFLAAREPGRPRENPRQVSAYHYPPQYGPKSPSFARATLKHWADADYLYISGTASIVGHESRHVADPAVQLEETLRNLEALIDSTAAEEGCRFRGLESITHLKAYVREPAHFPLVRQRLDGLFGSEVARFYFQGEICRPDLLLEIEAIVRA